MSTFYLISSYLLLIHRFMKKHFTFRQNEILLRVLISFLFISLSLITKSQEVNKISSTSKKAYITRTNLQSVSLAQKSYPSIAVSIKEDTTVVQKTYLIKKVAIIILPSESTSVKMVIYKKNVLKPTSFPSAQKKARKLNLKGGGYEDN
jgi:hypothetical protein